MSYRDMSIGELLALAPPGWGGALLNGLCLSLQVAGGGYFLGLLIGMAGAASKLSGGPVARDLWACYTTGIRAVPELVLILLLYFAVPEALNGVLTSIGVGEVSIGPFVSGIVVIALVQGAYATEVMRGAIRAIPRGQIEAAYSLGMSSAKTFRRITLPAMLPGALPGLSNLWLIATKDTALLAVVGFTELTLAARQAAGATKHHLLFLCAAGVLYLLVSLISNAVFKALERRATRGMSHG
ncbi:ABC transporter permease [Halomonas saccharevitans]|uniref:Amino acid ABC transporter membrane protein 1, PAAT family (TC 3.A.1.3.-) n=1 Tax=Halomonas saccharevitans TaxID=416872 RepID=A0A1I7CGN1_9GAMM|nr:ABC transporter permease [Halomonas saccharevitans]SFT98591.1 amino acid ABC transporter membrane protein 1, PAAT family (TC 3.A.1.3.-) [Halomonas saccharevitans]